ncbi:MAG: AAA family ATPase [Gammaproteobacteria bacterium]
MSVVDIQRLVDRAARFIPDEPEVTGVSLVCATDIRVEPIRWIWPGWLAGSKLHVLAGPPGSGKTTIALDLAAKVTNGGMWPDGARCERTGQVLVWSAEDSASDTLVPRLRAAGADLTRVRIVSRTRDDDGTRAFDPAHDIPLLEIACRDLDVMMLVVDPLVSAVASDSHKNAETRRSLQPLVDFAEQTGAAVLGISHFSKGTQGREPLERVTGSRAFGALARIVLGATKGDDDQRLLVRVKSNIGPDGGGYRYALDYPDQGGGIIGSRVVWGDAVEGDARTLIGASEIADDEATTEREDAIEWLREVLANGPVDSRELRKGADAAGHSWRTLNRAKKTVGVTAEKAAFAGGW